jgi:hypothetical protein
METDGADEDWAVLASFLPADWRGLAWSTGAVRRLRGFASEDALLRTFLLHVGRGLSLRETAATAAACGLASVSDVALLKRFRAAGPWLRALCVGLAGGGFAPSGSWDDAADLPDGTALRTHGYSMRLVDATHVSEPGKTGSIWRVHYALEVPGLICRHAELAPAAGQGAVESFAHFEAGPKICLIGDRGYSKGHGMAAVVDRGGDLLVRFHPFQMALRDTGGQTFDLEGKLAAWPADQLMGSWPCQIVRTRNQPAGPPVKGRLILVKRSARSAQRAIARAKRKSVNNQSRLQDRALHYAHWIMLFTTLPGDLFDDHACCQWYRLRWQIELAFKRLKSLAQLGHLPKRDPASVKAWLYGKLLAALLTEQLIRHSEAFSPWGYPISKNRTGNTTQPQPVACIQHGLPTAHRRHRKATTARPLPSAMDRLATSPRRTTTPTTQHRRIIKLALMGLVPLVLRCELLIFLN